MKKVVDDKVDSQSHIPGFYGYDLPVHHADTIL